VAAPATRTPPGPADAGDDSAGRTAGDRCPAAVPDVADDLADMLRRGRVCGTTGVARVEYVLVDGRRVGVDLPAPVKAGQPEAVNGLSEVARDIYEVLEDRGGDWVFGADIAADLPGHPDHKSTAFTGPIRELREAGLIDTSQKHGYRLKRKES